MSKVRSQNFTTYEIRMFLIGMPTNIWLGAMYCVIFGIVAKAHFAVSRLAKPSTPTNRVHISRP